MLDCHAAVASPELAAPHACATCRFSWGLGMPMVAKSDLSTQNSTFASYVLQSGELTFALTAPYSRARRREGSTPPLPWYDQDVAYDFLNRHGLAVRAIGGNRLLPRGHGNIVSCAALPVLSC